MRKIFYLLLVACCLLYACKKPRNETVNKAPVANAGANKTIVLPTDSVLLDGSNSKDPDGRIVSFEWTKISGPASFNIASANANKTWIRDLVKGFYLFQLKVTDDAGLTSGHSVSVTIIPDCSNRAEVNVQLIPMGNLSQTRSRIAVASASDKIFFAGGERAQAIASSRVDVFDINSNTWTTFELSEARTDIAAASLNGRIYFGGGFKWNDSVNSSSRVDIYNTQTNTWSIAELSSARGLMAAAAAKNKVLFAGGYGGGYQTTVDIYDESNNTWSVSHLANRPADASMGIATTVIGNKIYFAGAGEWPLREFGSATSVINIFDAMAGTWSVSELDYARGFLAAISIGNTNYWAGGDASPQGAILNTYSGEVEYGDPGIPAKSYSCLFQPNANFSAVRKDNKIIFFTGNGAVANQFDIYDFVANTWSVGVLPFSIRYASVISVNNTVYVAGGYVNEVLSDQVWRLEF